MKYKFCPRVVDAIKVGSNEYPGWLLDKIADRQIKVKDDVMYVKQGKTFLCVKAGQWLVCTETGEVHIYTDDYFQTHFMPAG